MDTLMKEHARLKAAERKAGAGSPAWVFYAAQLRKVLTVALAAYGRMAA